MDDPTSILTPSFTTGMGSNLIANVVTMLGVAILWSLKSLCSRNARMKSKCHTCCFDLEMVDRTKRAEEPPSITEDEETGSRV